MKVLLVGINSQYIHSNLAIRYLKAYTKDLDYDCAIAEFTINDRIENILTNIIDEKADLIGFSSYIWNIEFVTKLSNLIKKINPSIEIFYGGPEVSYDSEEFLTVNSGDYIIKGEGEETYRQLIECKIQEKAKDLFSKENIDKIDNIDNINKIRGIYYKSEGKIKYTGLREIMDMNKLIFPYEEEDELNNKIVYYEASRGCPFRCKYCLSSTDRNLRFINVERVKKELQYFIDKKVKLVKFVDRTFNCKHDYAEEIWGFIINSNTETSFHFEISADLLTEKEIQILKNAQKDRIQFEVGVQTTNNEILKNINRNVNFSTIEEKVKEVKGLNNIKQHLDLIAGLPGENLDSFKNSFNEVYEIKPEEIQLGFLKILKGSPMREEVHKWGMVYSPYPPYEILKTSSINYEELVTLKKIEEMVDKYYNSGKFKNITNLFIEKYEKPFDFYYELSIFYNKQGYFNRSISSTEYYKVFLDFNAEKFLVEEESLREIIKYDYLSYNKKKWLPPFLNGHMDKKETNNLKVKIKEIFPTIDFNKSHIEKFCIDIESFIKEKNIIIKDKYVLFLDEDHNVFLDL